MNACPVITVLCALVAVPFLTACRPAKSGGAPAAKPAAKPAAWTNFSGDRAFADVKALVAIGPRPSSSAGIETARQYIEKRLREAGWETRRQEFEDDTILRGRLKMANILARLPLAGTDTWGRPVASAVCSHYDTKWFQSTKFVGANDGGSSSGLLLEVARAAAAAPFAAGLELVFFDGEEAVSGFTAPGGFNDTRYDGLFGSRYYAKQLRGLPQNRRPRHGILFDMIGDQRLEVEFPGNGSRRLSALAHQAAAELNLSQHFRDAPAGDSMIDDHVPLSWLGMEVIDFIDLNSYRAFWHTSADTLDKINPASIEAAGRTGLLLIEKYLAE